MFGTNLEQRLPILDADVPYISTGYENGFGKYSSSCERVKQDTTVMRSEERRVGKECRL